LPRKSKNPWASITATKPNQNPNTQKKTQKNTASPQLITTTTSTASSSSSSSASRGSSRGIQKPTDSLASRGTFSGTNRSSAASSSNVTTTNVSTQGQPTAPSSRSWRTFPAMMASLESLPKRPPPAVGLPPRVRVGYTNIPREIVEASDGSRSSGFPPQSSGGEGFAPALSLPLSPGAEFLSPQLTLPTYSATAAAAATTNSASAQPLGSGGGPVSSAAEREALRKSLAQRRSAVGFADSPASHSPHNSSRSHQRQILETLPKANRPIPPQTPPSLTAPALDTSAQDDYNPEDIDEIVEYGPIVTVTPPSSNPSSRRTSPAGMTTAATTTNLPSTNIPATTNTASLTPTRSAPGVTTSPSALFASPSPPSRRTRPVATSTPQRPPTANYSLNDFLSCPPPGPSLLEDSPPPMASRRNSGHSTNSTNLASRTPSPLFGNVFTSPSPIFGSGRQRHHQQHQHTLPPVRSQEITPPMDPWDFDPFQEFANLPPPSSPLSLGPGASAATSPPLQTHPTPSLAATSRPPRRLIFDSEMAQGHKLPPTQPSLSPPQPNSRSSVTKRTYSQMAENQNSSSSLATGPTGGTGATSPTGLSSQPNAKRLKVTPTVTATATATANTSRSTGSSQKQNQQRAASVPRPSELVWTKEEDRSVMDFVLPPFLVWSSYLFRGQANFVECETKPEQTSPTGLGSGVVRLGPTAEGSIQSQVQQ